MEKQFDINKFNSFLDLATKTISCGPDCQKKQTEDDLKKKYIASEENLVLAKPTYEFAKKNYYIYTSGENAYNEMVENELIQESKIQKNEFQNIINKETNKIKTQIGSYNGLYINTQNIIELYHKYKKDNLMLLKEIKEGTNDILTNDRKTYYEDQNNDSLNFYYYYILLVLYIVIVICYIIFSFIYPSSLSNKFKIFSIILFIILPFISTWVLGTIIYIIYYLFDLLPKNVYK